MTSMINPSDISLETGTVVSELIVIDAAVSDKAPFYAKQGPGVAVVEIDSSQDGLGQLEALLVRYENLDAVHIVAHGDEGQLQLGNSTVDATALQASGDTLAALNAAIRDGGDILLYGCDVGDGEAGLALINTLADGANVDVAASDDLTGAAALGGDWDLEIQTGDIEAQSFSAASMADFTSVLAIPGTIGFTATDSPWGKYNYVASNNATYTSGGFTLTADGTSTATSIYNNELLAGIYGSGMEETRVTFSFTNNASFDLDGLSIYHYGAAPVQFFFTGSNSNSYDTILNGNSNTPITFNNDFHGITSFYVNAFANAPFAVKFDDIIVANVASNTNPTVSSLPAAVTVTEDSQSNVDLSAVVFSDADSPSITVTLTASAGTFATPADGAGVGAGVTETLQSATVITLVGAPGDINTYLDTTSNIQYTPAANVSGNAAATITVTMNDGDGSGNVAAGTVNVNVTAVNDDPTVSTLPAAVTVAEDTLSNITLGAASFADLDGDTITVTLTASAGTFATPADGAGVGAGVTETLVDAQNITLVGSAADINTYLDTALNIQYTAATNVSGVAAATITVRANDGAGSGDVNLGTVNVNVSAVNDVPVFTGLDGTPSYTEGGAAQILDANVTIGDVELDALNGGNGQYNGASLSLVRNGGANSQDIFSLVSGGNLTVAGGPDGGGTISAGGNIIANIANSGATGQLQINFVDNTTAPSRALVNEVMQAIRYSNNSNDPAANVQIDWTFSDGNSVNTQGTGSNPGTATGSVTVGITNVSDAPSLSATGGNPTFTEGGGAQDLFNTVTASAVEAADRISAMTLTVTNVSDGASEILSFDGSDVALTNGTSVNTATNGLTVNVSVAGSTATVSFTGATLTGAQFQTLIDGITYRNSSEDPTTAGNRVVTVTGITDTGTTANGGVNTAAPNIVSTVSITAVNDAPVIGNLAGETSQVIAGNGAQDIVGFNDATVANPDSADYNGGFITIAQTSGTTNGSWLVDGTTVTSGGDASVSAGETIAVSGVNIGTVDAINDGQGGNGFTINFGAKPTDPEQYCRRYGDGRYAHQHPD